MHHLLANLMRTINAFVFTCHALSPPAVVEVSWIISDPIEVNEGNQSQMFVTLRAQAFGFYASPIAIGVVCAEVIATGVPPGADTTSSTDTLKHAIMYTTLHVFVCSLP